ncbi:MAG TPA: hypothetical protein VFZ97_18715 [Acidimicrobiales bacterium]
MTLLLVGRGQLTRVPVMHPTNLPGWWAASGPIVGLFGLLRVALLGVSVYWTGLALLCVGVCSITGGSRRMAKLSGRLPGFGWLARGLASTSIVGAALIVGSTPSIADTNAPPATGSTATTVEPPTQPPASDQLTPPRLVPLSPHAKGEHRSRRRATGGGIAPPPGVSPVDAGTAGTLPAEVAPAVEPAVVGRAPAIGGPAPAVEPAVVGPAPALSPAPGPATQPSPVASPSSAQVPSTTIRPLEAWKVRPGDNLWSIAQSAMAERLGRQPSDSETARYWLQVIEANRLRLPDPKNPSLLFAGDLISLPSPR